MGRRRLKDPTAAAGWIPACTGTSFGVVDRSETTFQRLYDRLREAERYRSDHCRVYEWLPAHRHWIWMGKDSAVNRDEGTHSRRRDPLRQLQRRTKGYTKSLTMLSGSIA